MVKNRDKRIKTDILKWENKNRLSIVSVWCDHMVIKFMFEPWTVLWKHLWNIANINYMEKMSLSIQKPAAYKYNMHVINILFGLSM